MADSATGGGGGALTGFLAGTALCSLVAAGLSVAFPLEATAPVAASVTPEVVETPTLSSGDVPEDAAPTIARSDAPSDDIALSAPVAEAPAPDRDTQTVTLEAPEDSQPVQTGTDALTGPETSQAGAPEPAAVEQPEPVSNPQPLETAESVAVEDTPEVVAEPAAPATAESVETAPSISQPEAPSSSDDQAIASLASPQPDTVPTPSSTTDQAPGSNAGPQAPQPIIIADQPKVDVETPNVPNIGDDDPVVALAEPRQESSPTIDTDPGENAVVTVAPPASPEQAEQPEPAQVQENTETPPAPPELVGDAFDAFAVDYAPPDDGPLLAIILEDIGEGGVSVEDLASFGAAVTYGVDADDERARWRDAAFRDAGFEVVALIPAEAGRNLTQNSDAGEVPSLIKDYFTAVPGAVALIDTPISDMYRNPRLVGQLAGELNETGRGLLIHEKFGVNRALEAARSNGIPSASMLRIIDETRDAASIRRALDRASLDASKTGAAIVYGRTYPETVAAILPWLLSNSARSVNLAPLTATMRRAQ